MKKTIIWGESPTKGDLDSLQIYEKAWQKRRGDVFEGGRGGGETPMHTISWRSILMDTNIQSK